MEGSVSNVQFTERKRGFDPDEVANYLAQIDDKIAGLRSIAAEAIERAEQAEERARVAEERAGSGADTPAQAASVLSLAQQTADATLTEARAEADALLRAAREDADRQRLAADAEAQQLLSDTRRDLEARRSEHLDALRGEIDELAAARDGVAAEVAALEAHLAAQRERVVEARDALTRIADDPDALGAVAPPVVVAGPAASAWRPEGDVSEGVIEGMEGDALLADATSDVAADAAEVGWEPAMEAEVVEVAVVETTIVTADDLGQAVVEVDVVEVDVVEADALTDAATDWGSADPSATAPVSAVGGLFHDDAVDEPAPPVGAETSGGLFGEEATSASAFGSPDDADDEAMRAFFEGDLEEEERPGRWGFRRR